MSKLFDEAHHRLGSKLPAALKRAMERLRRPGARWLRIPLGVVCVLGGFLWFLPMLGLWMLPLGLLLLAQDIPVLRAPVGRASMWLLDRWDALVRRWRK